VIELKGKYYLQFETSTAIRRAFKGKLEAYRAFRASGVLDMQYSTFRMIMRHHPATQEQVAAVEEAFRRVPI
jgi:hypothetical protein